MSTTAAWDLQKAIVTALKANAALVALGVGVYDEVPETTPCPYVIVGKVIEADAPTFGEDGHELRPQIKTWTEDGTDRPANTGASGFKQGLSIAELVKATIMDDAFAVDGRGVCVLRMEEMESESFNDPQPTLRCITQTFVIEVTESE